ncbi:accessory gene regulator B family protein [Wujia sp.]|uniref:accessory gene regulator B family protein n=1 Tax=Wujia sp. TaxID=2944172 RepID=UPI003F7CF480
MNVRSSLIFDRSYPFFYLSDVLCYTVKNERINEMILSKKISKKITDILVTNEIIESQKKDIYFYCLDFALDLILFNCSLLTVMIWVLAPVGNAHKHYTTAERTKIKKILFFLLFFIYAFAVLMLSWKQQLYYHMILICLCIVLINQCIARCLNHRTLHVSKGEKK